jgi:dTMP kinase
MSLPHGVFITFEGSEGCGKTTQIQRLSVRLQNTGLQVLLTREPGGTPLGESIRHLLKFAEEGKDMTPEAELLLFAASRAQLVRRVIAPALDAGNWVIADRFMDSTTVYQGIARRLDHGAVRFINEFAVGDRRPDLTFVLDVESEETRRRLLRRPRPVGAPDRMEQMPPEFYDAVRAGYQALARDNPGRFRVIQAGRSVEAVEMEVWEHVSELIKSAPGS